MTPARRLVVDLASPHAAWRVPATAVSTIHAAVGPGWDVPPNMTLEDIERLVIERTLQRTGGNKQAAANLLGIYRPRLYSKIRKYNIDVGSLVSA